MNLGAARRMALFALLTILVLSSVAALAIWKPYIEVTEVRATTTPQTVQVMWYLACEADYYEDDRKQRYLPEVPAGGKEPVVGPFMMSGTQFVLVGYPYMELHRNRFTGQVDQQRSERFDVIEWHVVPPYLIWDGKKEIERNEPAGWKSQEIPARFAAQIDRPRETC
jgi:hypothetical protein